MVRFSQKRLRKGVGAGPVGPLLAKQETIFKHSDQVRGCTCFIFCILVLATTFPVVLLAGGVSVEVGLLGFAVVVGADPFAVLAGKQTLSKGFAENSDLCITLG